MSKQAENSMSAATDKGVLAVMDAEIASLEARLLRCKRQDGSGNAPLIRIKLATAREARATVAELIATGQRTRAALPVLMNLIIGMYGEESGGAAKAAMLIAEWDAALALARCGGAQ